MKTYVEKVIISLCTPASVEKVQQETLQSRLMEEKLSKYESPMLYVEEVPMDNFMTASIAL